MENCLGEPPQSSGDYYPHYSLFQSSLFYDTDNIRRASLTCKYDSFTTESGIRTFEYRKSSAELDVCRTESPKSPGDLARNIQPTDKEDIGGHRGRWYSQFGPKCCENLTHSIKPPDKKNIKSCGTVSGPKDLAHNTEPLDKEDIGDGYTLFRPNWSDNLVRSIGPQDKKDKERCRTVSGPIWPLDLASNAKPLDKEETEGVYTLFGPKWSDNLEHRIEPPGKVDIERCHTLSGSMWPMDLACRADPPGKEDTERVFRPKWCDNLVRSIEPLVKKDIKSCGNLSGPKWSKDLVSNAEPLDGQDIDEGYTLFGPIWSKDPVRNQEPLYKEGKERCRTVSRPKCPEDLPRRAEPLDIKRCHTVSWPKCFEDLSRSIEPLNKQNTERCLTVSGPQPSEDLACSTEPLGKEDEEDVETDPDKRIITKKDLYRNPDLFQSRSEYVEPIAPQPKKPKPWGYYDWTRQIWIHKDTGKRVPMNRREELEEEQRQAWGEAWREERRGEWRGVRGGGQPGPLAEQSRGQRGVAENMTQRVGWHGGDPAPRTMNQMTGWQGGALGRVGDGIHQPSMTKELNNASRDAGVGKRTGRPKKLSGRDAFSTNVLLYILDFIKDDTQVLLTFDVSLKTSERRHIKNIVSQIIRAGNIELLGTVGQYDILLDIQSQNQYRISAVSEGDEVTRWLSIYKEAPGHVYLVTPDDFLAKEHDEIDEKSSENSIIQDDDNPFLRSIEKGLKKKFVKQCNISKRAKRKSTPKQKMLEFFLDFVDSECFTEMWFLGKFDEEQVQAINDLLNDLSTCIDDLGSFRGDKEMAKVFRSGEMLFELKEGSNGTTEIHKLSANPPTEEQLSPPPGAQKGP